VGQRGRRHVDIDDVGDRGHGGELGRIHSGDCAGGNDRDHERRLDLDQLFGNLFLVDSDVDQPGNDIHQHTGLLLGDRWVVDVDHDRVDHVDQLRRQRSAGRP
jgi:hypothetical protein